MEGEAEFGGLAPEVPLLAFGHLLLVLLEALFDILEPMGHDLPVEHGQFACGGDDGDGGPTAATDAPIELPEHAVFGFCQAQDRFPKDLGDFGLASRHASSLRLRLCDYAPAP